MGAGSPAQCSVMTWSRGGGVGVRLEREAIYVYSELIHADVRQKPTQLCKAIIPQLKLIFFFFFKEKETSIVTDMRQRVFFYGTDPLPLCCLGMARGNGALTSLSTSWQLPASWLSLLPRGHICSHSGSKRQLHVCDCSCHVLV